ncbi:cytochrome c oxidase assembly protein subunit 23 [Sarotherodon galilaeus]
MDPAALNPSKELRENLIDATQELIDLWLENPDVKSQRAIERRLQRLVTGLPWLLGSLYPWEQEFLLLDLGLHPPSAFTFEQPEAGDKLFQNGPVPLKLTTLETVTRSRASPEAGLQPSANSGPLEAKLPAVDCTRLSLPEQGQGSVQLQPSSCVPEAHVPTGFVSRLSEAHEPAGFVLCMPGASMPTGFEPVFAGGTEEPIQPSPSSAASAEESREPLQPAAFAGGTEEPIQLSPLPAAPPSPAPMPPPAAPPSPASTPPPAAPPSPALKPPPAAPPAIVSGILASCSLFVFTSSCSGSITACSSGSISACTSGCSSSITACTSICGSYAVAFFASASVPSPGQASEPSASPASASASPSSSSGPASVSSSSSGPASVSSSSSGPASVSASSSGPASVSASSSGPASVSASSSGPAVVSASSSGPAVVSASSSGPAVVSVSSSGPASSSASASPGPATSSASASPAAAASSAAASSASSPAAASSASSPAAASSASSPAAASSASSPAAAASASSPAAAASASPGPASVSAPASPFSSSLPGSAGTPPSGPRPAPHFHWPFSRPLDGRHRRCGRPPEQGCRRHHLPRGRPPDFCGRHGLPRGRPPDFCGRHGLPRRPSELCFRLCSPVSFVNVLFGTLEPPFWSWSGPSVLDPLPPTRVWWCFSVAVGSQPLRGGYCHDPESVTQ